MIDGKQVRLRALSVDDTDRYVAWFNDPEVTEYLSHRYPMSRESEEGWLRARTSTPLSYDNPNFAIETADGLHIGSVGFHVTRPEDRNARLGIVIGDKRYWSRGYGTDAIVTLLRFAFDEMNLHRVDLTVDGDNARAIACYGKCGFRDEVRMRRERYRHGEYVDQLVMGILRDEFYALHGAPSA